MKPTESLKGSYDAISFTFMHLADAFIQSDLQCFQVIHFFISMCVPWELNPQPFALLTQCSTTEPQEHIFPVAQDFKFSFLFGVLQADCA